MSGEGKTFCNDCGMLLSQSCHAELVSASSRRSGGRILSNLIGGQTLNQVQGDKIIKNLFTYSPIHLLTSKKVAFTLAEVLITLAIIGVVAAMTIPTLISDYQEKANVTKLKVTYSMLANAWQLAYANKGEFKDGDPDDLYNYISPYIKFSKYCGRETGCWPDLMIKFLHGTDWVNIDSYTNYRKAIISNGSLIQFYARSYDNKAPEFRVDINGFAGPNSLGKDIFYFKVENNRVLPRGQKGTDFRPFETHCNMASAVDYNGDSCSAWVIQNNNMDYLHCDDLSWDGKRKCSD